MTEWGRLKDMWQCFCGDTFYYRASEALQEVRYQHGENPEAALPFPAWRMFEDGDAVSKETVNWINRIHERMGGDRRPTPDIRSTT